MTTAAYAPDVLRSDDDRRYGAAADLLRLGCALVIVLFHAEAPGGWLMPAAMGVFTGLLVYFSARAAGAHAMNSFARRRAARLLRPFAAWTVIYLGLRVVQAAVTGEDPRLAVAGWLPPAGTMHQLWFLPWGFVAGLAAFALGRGPVQMHPLVIIAGAALGAAAVLAALAGADLAPGVLVMAAYLPSAFFALALAWLPDGYRWPVVAALVAAATGLAFARTLPDLSLQLLLGVPLIVAVLLYPLPVRRRLTLLSDLAMGLYLIHVAALVALRIILGPETSALTLGLAAAALSLVLARSLSRTWLRHILL